MTMTKEQIAQLPGLVERFDCHGWDIRRGIMRLSDDGAWVQYDDYAPLAAAVIEQQAEIERLREALKRCLNFLDIEDTENEFGIALGSGDTARTALGDTQ